MHKIRSNNLTSKSCGSLATYPSVRFENAAGHGLLFQILGRDIFFGSSDVYCIWFWTKLFYKWVRMYCGVFVHENASSS